MEYRDRKFILSWVLFLTLSLLSLNAHSLEPRGDDREMFYNSPTGIVVNPVVEPVKPAFQKCGDHYVETKVDSNPLGSELDLITYWACKLKEDFYNPADVCLFSIGGGKITKSFVNANYYGCSYEDKTVKPTASCLQGYSVSDLEERTETRTWVNPNGFCVNGKCFPTVQAYNVYFTDFKCLSEGASFPEGNYYGDRDACKPADSWLGATESDPSLQICGYKRESSAPYSPPDDSGSAPIPPSGFPPHHPSLSQ